MRQPDYLLILARVTGATGLQCINLFHWSRGGEGMERGQGMEDVRYWGGRQYDQVKGRKEDGRMNGDTTKTLYR